MVDVKRTLISFETKNHKTPDLTVYKDSEGYPTVGIGHLVTARDKLKLGDKIDAKTAYALFAADLRIAASGAKSEAAAAGITDSEVRNFLTMAIFQLGIVKWKKFKKTRALLRAGKFSDAADELANSKWYRSKGMPKRIKPFQDALRRLDSGGG